MPLGSYVAAAVPATRSSSARRADRGEPEERAAWLSEDLAERRVAASAGCRCLIRATRRDAHGGAHPDGGVGRTSRRQDRGLLRPCLDRDGAGALTHPIRFSATGEEDLDAGAYQKLVEWIYFSIASHVYARSGRTSVARSLCPGATSVPRRTSTRRRIVLRSSSTPTAMRRSHGSNEASMTPTGDGRLESSPEAGMITNSGMRSRPTATKASVLWPRLGRTEPS